MTTTIDAASSSSGATSASATAKDAALSPALQPPPPPAPAPSTPAMVAPATAAQLASAALPPPPPLDAIFPSGDQIDMRLLMMTLWTHRRDAAFTREVCARLAHPTALSGATLDQVEFFLPQLAHMVVHLERELPIEDVEQFVLLLSQSSVHFALQLFWIVYAALDENRPKRAGGNPRTFARCAQLLLALEQCLVYGSPVARELSELLTQNSISKAEMEQLLLADRRFFAASQRAEAEESTSDGLAARAEGWLFKKGGGTRAMGRRNWRRRWCRIERRVLLVFAGPGDVHPRTAVPLDRAEVRVVENPKHPFYFELIHEFSETTMKFAAPSQDELVLWMQHLHRAAAAPEPPASRTNSRHASATNSAGGGGNARATLARMSWGMRSFILDASASGTTAAGESGDDAVDAPGSPSKAAASAIAGVSPPASPRAKSQAPAPSPFGATDAWSESQRRTRAVSSVSSASAHSSEVSDLSSVLLAEALLQQQPALPYDQQKRYEFFTGMITFVKSITDVSESLRRVEPPKRKSLLRPRLEALAVPRNAYLPLCKSTDVYCRVRAVLTGEGRVFNTNERAPCLLYLETEEDELRQDVSQALFEYLYAEDDDEGVAGSEQDPAVVVDSVDDDMLRVPLRSPNGGRAPPAAAGGSGRSPRSERSPFLEQLLIDPERKQRIEKIFGELSFSAAARLQQSASDPARWRLSTLIAKSYDDLRQEVLVMQLITYFDRIFRAEELPLRLHPYRILSTGASTGLIEVVRNATSLDCIKKSRGFKNLRHHFEQLYGGGEGACGDAELLRQAELNFTHSLAAYSIVCYILSIKDRHNGNIMLDVEGHLVHIDFGFFLGRAPGGSFSFETAPFKLTAEMVDVLGGRQSSLFQYYRELCVKGALAARKHADTIYALVEVMSLHSRMPCFAGNASTTAVALAGLRERLFLTTPEDKIEPAILQMIERSYDHFGTTKYDQFQVYSNGIAK